MRQLQDVQVEGMALVRRPANKKRFLTKKSEEAAVANFSDQVAAPDSAVSDAIDAIRLTKGESENGHEALHAAAHLLAGRADISHEDAMAFVDALSLQKAAKKDESKDKDDEDNGEEQDEADDADNEEEEGEEEDDDEMPAFLKRKLNKADWEEAQHPRDDHGRFGEGGGGGESNSSAGSGSSGGSEKDAFGRRGSGSASSPGLKGQAANAKEIRLQRISQEANKASERAGGRSGADGHKAAEKAHLDAAKSYRAAASAKGVSEKDKATYLKAAANHSEKGGEHFSQRNGMKKTADVSANQGGPMEADSREFVSKSDHEALLERLSKSELELADIRGREELRLEKSANEEAYGHLEVDHDALADVTLSLRKASDKKLDALATILKAANEQVRVAKASGGSPFRPQSIRGGVAKSQAAGLGQFQQMVADHQKANPGVTAAQAVTAVAKSAEGLAAYRASKGEN